MQNRIIERYVHKKVIISLTALLFLLVASYSLCAYFSRFLPDNEPRIEINFINSPNGDAAAFRFKDIGPLRNIFTDTLSFSSNRDTSAEAGSVSQPVKAVLTDDEYFLFSTGKVSRGSFFSKDAFDNGRRTAVISERLAGKLFMNLDAVGNEIRLFGQVYKVVGIYEDTESLVSVLDSDGYDRVYIPFTSLESMDSEPIHTLYINDGSFNDEKFKQEKIQELMRKSFGAAADSYKVIDYDGGATQLLQAPDIFIFIVSLYVIFILIRLAQKYLEKNAGYIRQQLQESYFIDFLKRKYPYCLLFLGTILLWAAALIVIFLLYKPAIHIPPQYVPQDNVFDFGFYWNLIKSGIQSSNADRAYIPTEMESALKSIQLINLVLAIAMLFIFISLSAGIKMLTAIGTRPKEYLRIAVLVIVSLSLLCIISYLMGVFKTVLPIKDIIIILVFCILRGFIFIVPRHRLSQS